MIATRRPVPDLEDCFCCWGGGIWAAIWAPNMSCSTAGCAAEKPDGAPLGVSAQAAMSSADGGGATGRATESAEPAAEATEPATGAADCAEVIASAEPASGH